MTASKPSIVERLTTELQRRGRLAPPEGTHNPRTPPSGRQQPADHQDHNP